METVRYKHEVNSGDLICALAGMKHVFETTGKKAVIQQRLNLEGHYYDGATHPLKHNGRQVTMTEKQWDMLKPLLLSQDYVESCERWEGQEFDLDLNKMRAGDYTTAPFGSLARWPFYTDPALACDLSQPWLSLPKIAGYEDKVILNFTSRYRNHLVSYYFLKQFEPQLIFAGTKDEHETFCSEYNLTIPYLEVENFYQLGIILNSAKFFLGCQSFCWNVVESLKTPRILECYRNASNCIPIGKLAYDFIHQGPLEFYFQKLMNL